MNCIIGIKKSLERKDKPLEIARKIYLSYNTEIFKDNQEDEFYIKNEISKEFDIPFASIEIVGSSKTGLSFIKDKKFVPGESDLDIAIISLPLFIKFNEIAHKETKGYSDLSKFIFFKGNRTDRQFIQGMSMGFINPYYMPKCEFRNRWLAFFNKLSNNYIGLFKNINGGVYASEYFFECKQIECIERYKMNPGLYERLM